MKMPRPRRNSAIRAGFTLVEMIAVLAILAIAAGLAVPMFASMSSSSAVRSGAGKVANLVNRRIALARSGGGPSEITLSGDSKVIVVIPEEMEASSATSGANSVLGHDLLKPVATQNTRPEVSEDEAIEIADLDGVRVDALYVKAGATGENKDTLAISAGGVCDEALFMLSDGDARACVSVRGLSGRARVYETVPSYLAGYFEVPLDDAARAK